MSYPRKRIAVACEFCRQRKRRCDGRKPVCSKCAEAGADCQWQDLPVQRLGSAQPSFDSSTSERLERIEALLEAHSETINAISNVHALSQQRQNDTAGSLLPPCRGPVSEVAFIHESVSPGRTRYSNASIAATSPAVVDQLPPLTIPQKHQTSTNSLLTLPAIRSLLGDFPDDFFFRLESQRVKFDRRDFRQQTLPSIGREVTDPLVEAFFTAVYPCHPILDEDDFFTSYEKILTHGLAFDLESALCMVVLALGTIVSLPCESEAKDASWAPGIEYFTPAVDILAAEATWFHKPSLSLVRALLFAGIYSAFLAQPFHSWKLIHTASTNVQLLLSRYHDERIDEKLKSQINMASWSCYLIECDRLAELNLPRSGIESFVDQMAFPNPGNPPDLHRLSYLAEISIRRLLNRVHDSIYNVEGQKAFLPATLSSVDTIQIDQLLSITSELDRQLLDWYDSIPDIIKPSLDTEATRDDRQRILRIRYFATSHIIHRPFVLYLASLPETQRPSELILGKAQTCLESCRLYIQNTGAILYRPSQYTWTLSQSSLGAIIVLTIASLSFHLKHLVTDIRTLQQLVVKNVEKWAAPDSSFESVVWIINTISKKTQFL